ncbi:MAG TPA: NAD(P)-dependent oxidoreductase [Bryobacteraceae bacterium]|nr:NAD(P)-dependent oxidoreductase [Bryobacteraceae bacterium]
MAKLGFLGLGIMGYPMARNLIRGGHEVALWSHSGTKAKKLAAEEKSGIPCETPRQVAEHADVIFLCVGDTEMSEKVILGPGGLLEGAKAGKVIVDASTVSPSHSIKMRDALKEKGVDYLDAPCTGSKPGAEGGNLTFMIGGDQAVFERIKPFLEPMGKQLFYCGGHGMGTNAKLTQNLVLSNILQAFNEGIVLSTKAGVDPRLMLEILDKSAAKCGLINFKAPFVLARNFETNFSVKWMHKDIGLMLDSAQELGVPLPLTSLTQQMFRAAIAKGHGDADICSTIKVLEDWTGVEVKDSQK